MALYRDGCEDPSPSFRAKARSAVVEESPSSWPNGSLSRRLRFLDSLRSLGMTPAWPNGSLSGRPRGPQPVIPSEGAKRRSRGIAVVLAEWLSIGTAAIPRLAALARNDTSLAEWLSIGTAAMTPARHSERRREAP